MRWALYISGFWAVVPYCLQLSISDLPNDARIPQRESILPFFPGIQPASLPFWDDFSVSENSVDSLRIWGTDTFLQWDPMLSKGVFINSTLAINPPTYNVATFDGLDANGGFYSLEDNAVGLTDQLVSYPINLLGASNIYISFFWQAGGNVEVPEEQDFIELILEDLNDDRDTVIWSQTGGASMDITAFTQTIRRIPDEFESDSVRLRFRAHGDQDGPFDAWHIDWVYLNGGRNPSDLAYFDRAISGDLTSPFRPFQSIPINQFDSKFLQNQSVGSSNLHHTIHTNEIGYKIRNTLSNSLIVDDPPRLYSTLAAFERDTVTLLQGTADQDGLSSFDFSELLDFDSVVIEAILEYKSNDTSSFAPPVDLRVNDTVRENYTLYNYYAFDDGTAEYAAGTNIRGGQVSVKFWVEQTDTLTHIDINFPNIAPNQNERAVTLQVFNDLSESGLRRSQQVLVSNHSSRNAFTRYALDRPLVVPDTFFIGYQQSVNDFLAVGFDRSNPEAAPYIFENKDGNWTQNIALQGALMIRPVFENLAEWVLSEEPDLHEGIAIYPNPTSGPFRTEGVYVKLEVMDLSGKILQIDGPKGFHDISALPKGIYLLRIHKSDRFDTIKIIRK